MALNLPEIKQGMYNCLIPTAAGLAKSFKRLNINNYSFFVFVRL